MKTLLTDYDKLMKDNQSKQVIFFCLFRSILFYLELLTRYNATKTMLNEYEKKSQLSSRPPPPPSNEFPDPQRVKNLVLSFKCLSFDCSLVFHTD